MADRREEMENDEECKREQSVNDGR